MTMRPLATGTTWFMTQIVANNHGDTASELDRARLQATFDSEDDPQVTSHGFRNAIDPSSTRREEWERQKMLGSGGFGTVFLDKCMRVNGYVEVDEDDKTGQLRAVKWITKAKNQTSLSKDSIRELNSLVFFSGPAYEYHFVKTFGWYENPSTLFIAMEYCPLSDLNSYLVEHGPVSEKHAKYITGQMLRGIESMHANNFIHRDLKPDNLWIKSRPPKGEWWVKISDFGISKEMKESRTLSSTLCGTMGFMAPERLGFDTGSQHLSHLVRGKAADIWAAGETIFRMLTGKASFGENLRFLAEYAMSQVKFPRTVLLKAGVSSEGATFIEHCMAPKPSSRPSATYALRQLGWAFSLPNAYEGWTVEVDHTLKCKGTDKPFILFTPDMDKLIVITNYKIYLWGVEADRVVKSWTSDDGSIFSQGCISADGRYLCVTQAKLTLPALIFDAMALEPIREVRDKLEYSCGGKKISTFSHDGETYNWKLIETHLSAATRARDGSAAKNIKSMAFTNDSKRLVAAYENMIVIKDTSDFPWRNIQVTDYPGIATAAAVSPGVQLLWLVSFIASFVSASGCNSTPISLPIQDTQVLPNIEGSNMYGLRVQIGSPAQDIVMMPWAELNNTWIYNYETYCNNEFIRNNLICQVRRGNYLYENGSSTFEKKTNMNDAGGAAQEASEMDGLEAGIPDLLSSSLFGTDVFAFGSIKATGFPIGIPGLRWDHGYSSLHALGLGRDSTLLKHLVDTGQIASRVWSIFWGRMWTADAFDGSVVLGGYNSKLVTGDNYTWPLDYESCFNGLKVTITGITLNKRNGQDANILQTQVEVPCCIVPQRQFLMEAPYFIMQAFEGSTGMNGSTRSKGLHWSAPTYSATNAYNGDLTIRLSNGPSIRVPNTQFLVPHVDIADNGTRVTNDTQVDFLFNNAEGSRVATLGRYFLTAAHLMVNHDANTFTLWQAAPYTSEPVLVPVIGESENQSCSSIDDSSIPSHTTSSISVGAVAGAAVGGVAVAAAIAIAVFLTVRRRRRNRLAARPGPVEHSGNNTDEYTKPYVLSEMPHEVRPQEMEEPQLQREGYRVSEYRQVSPTARRPVYEMDGYGQAS
ncbi:hypothetical protein Daus18300_012810 [Diaporthe australafricana]|uniref:Autophagy-related protein 1 n=1 Tax=Diaporthe australafricana TaxID=127596 RepID=A0ABR3W1N0_9PEZI